MSRPRVHKIGPVWRVEWDGRLRGAFGTIEKAQDHAHRIVRARAHAALVGTLARAAEAHTNGEQPMTGYIVAPLSAILAVLAFARGDHTTGTLWTVAAIAWGTSAAITHPLGRVPVLTTTWEAIRDGIENTVTRAQAWIIRKATR